MSRECETCKASEVPGSRRVSVTYVEEYGMMLCGACECKMDDGVEEWEERNRRRIAESNEY